MLLAHLSRLMTLAFSNITGFQRTVYFRARAGGKILLSISSLEMDRTTAIEKPAIVEGNTEVYAIARTSDYSLGFAFKVSGAQRLEDVLRREWTVRQYCPNGLDPSILSKPP